MNIDNLETCFNVAQDTHQKFIGILINMEGFEKPELIINENENFKGKLAYYKKAYNEDLTLKANKNIKIIGFVFGGSVEDIHRYLKRSISQ